MSFDYEPELSFFRNVLENMHIKNYILEKGGEQNAEFKKMLLVCPEEDSPYSQLFDCSWELLEENTVYRIGDGFFGNYIFFIIPSDSKKVLAAGPYVTNALTRCSLLELCEKRSISPAFTSVLQKYYGSLPLIGDTETLSAIINTLGCRLWGSLENFSIKKIDNFNNNQNGDYISYGLLKNKTGDSNALDSLKIIEARYAAENSLMHAVSQGISHKAEQIFSHFSETVLEMRFEDPVRNLKNYTFVLNTLLRKAAEYGAVHPLYIDEVSSDFAKKIEKIPSVNEGLKLQSEMINKYCRIVKKHSMKEYSLLIQKVITTVDSDITADLSLRHLAEMLNVNASYLSGLFKKETGVTLTDYVSKKRVEFAANLLERTNLQIQTVAQHCGIFDVNYFTKTFKKYMNVSPKEYRKKAVSRS